MLKMRSNDRSMTFAALAGLETKLKPGVGVRGAKNRGSGRCAMRKQQPALARYATPCRVTAR